MIRWVLAIIGLAYGWEMFDLKVGVLLAVVGFVIGRRLEQRGSDSTPPVRRPANTVAQELQQLKQRVAQLESEVAQLKVGANPSTDSTPAEVAESNSPTWDLATAATPSTPITPVTASSIAAVSSSEASPTPPELHVPQPVSSSIPQTPPAPHPSPIDQAISAAQNWLFGGNTVVRLGMLILFFGVSFLLKFAADNQLLPIEARLAGLSLGAAAIFIVGWRLRHTRRSYALIMQGGALGLLYFTVYGAMKLYQLIPSSSAFALLALLGVAAAVLSIRQNASALAVTGIFGGFLAPILTSDGSGNHVMLFTYFAVLNAGIFAIAWFKAWRALNLLGFIFTYLIATLWGLFDYRSELRASTLPFVVIFWLFFAAISTLYAIKRSHTLRSMVDGTLVFGTPIITMGLLSRLMSDTEYGLCFSALIGATFYLGLAAWLHARRDDSLRLFTEAQLAIGVLLATLAIPLAFDGNVTAAMWAVEGAGVVWISLRQPSQTRKLSLLFGLILQFAAGLAVVMSSPYYTEIPLLNGVYLANLLLALSGLFCAWQLHEQQSDGPLKSRLSQFGWLLGGWGLLWWGKAHWDEINTFLSGDARFNAALLLIALTAGLFQQLALRGWWRNARVVALALGPVLLLLAAEQYTQWPHLFSLWAWPVAVIALFALLYQQDASESGCDTWQHVIAAWLSWGIFINEIIYLSSQHIHTDVSRLAAFAALASAAVAAIKFLPWPINAHWRAYWVYGTAPMAVLLCWWGFYSALSGGTSGLPLLNALDLAQLATLLVLGFWLKHTLIELTIPTPPRWLWATAGAAIFVWLNAMLLRTLHHQQQIAYTFDSLRNSNLVQMSLSIFWTLISLTLMFAATRKHWRTLWLVGASLQAIVIGKLFIIDLSHISGLERIASFMGVGLLLLLIGYLAPIPPEKTGHRSHNNQQQEKSCRNK